jgi:hypothetical protein
MDFVKIIYNKNSYDYNDASSMKMAILGLFLTSDVSNRPSSFKNWIFDDQSVNGCSNITAFEKENNYILLTDMYSEEETPTVLKITREQFIQILTDWEEKVLKLKPKEIIIKYENDQFIIETKD